MNQQDIEASLRAYFADLWARLPNGSTRGPGAFGDSGVYFEFLRAAYQEPPRAYHTLTHVWWGLTRIDEIAQSTPAFEASSKSAIEFAMFYHDAVMSFGEGGESDEEESAHMASDVINDVGLTMGFMLNVQRLIRATDHMNEPQQLDEAILVDADLSILGANQEAFRDYELRVRKEWRHVSDSDFRAGRLKVLERFAKKSRIFTTDYGHRKWERMARFNIEQSMWKLQPGRLWP